MTPLQIIEALGIEVTTRRSGLTVDSSPTAQAQIKFNDGKFFVWYEGDVNSQISAIHEALHLVIGPSSFDDEGALMALEDAVCRELDPDPYRSWRFCFSDYGLNDKGRMVGPGDAFRKTAGWRHNLNQAIEADVILPDGRPIWGKGVHPELELFLKEDKDEDFPGLFICTKQVESYMKAFYGTKENP